jgi:P pilus assembly chaperone PapD
MPKRYIIILFILSLFLFYSSSAQALGFVLSPPRFEFTMPPGGSTTEGVELTNLEEVSLELRAYISDWELDTKGNQSYKKPGTFKTSCSNWVKVNPQRLTLGPKESRLARFTITAPPSGVSGSYWTVLFFESKPTAPAKAPMGVTFAGRLGVIIYATIAGTEVRAGKILDLKILKDKEDKYNFTVTFENAGNIHLRPKGTWEIKNEAGKKVKKGEIGEFLVLPKAQHTQEVPLDMVQPTAEASKTPPAEAPPPPTLLPPGKYTLAVEADYGAKELVGGDLMFEVPGAGK